MTAAKQGAERADPFAGDFDVSGFKPAAPKKPAAGPEVIRKVSEEQNFPSRAPVRKAARPQRRHRTGRNVQLNIKATPETIERFLSIADKQKWVLGEALEHALDALEASLAAEKSGS